MDQPGPARGRHPPARPRAGARLAVRRRGARRSQGRDAGERGHRGLHGPRHRPPRRARGRRRRARPRDGHRPPEPRLGAAIHIRRRHVRLARAREPAVGSRIDHLHSRRRPTGGSRRGARRARGAPDVAAAAASARREPGAPGARLRDPPRARGRRSTHARGPHRGRRARAGRPRPGKRPDISLRRARRSRRIRHDGLRGALRARGGDPPGRDSALGADEPRGHRLGRGRAPLVGDRAGERRERLHRLPRRGGRRPRPRRVHARAGDHVRGSRRGAGHLPVRRHRGGFGRDPQRERAVERSDGRRALTSPRPGVTNNFYMDHFAYRNSELCCERVSLCALAADVGTPAYVYSKDALLDNYRAYDRTLAEVPHLVCYSVKANANLGVLATLARAGAGADVVAGGELFRALRAGFPPSTIIFDGVGKTREELRDALKAEIRMFNVESLSELRALGEVAREMGVRAPVALRVNPDVDPQTHPYIATGLKTSKFGIPFAQALEAYAEAASLEGVEVVGADIHIGSQLTKTSPFADAIARVAALVKTLREHSIEIRTVDVGGGRGIRYGDEAPPTHREYATVLLEALRELGVTVLLEPGRSIVGNAGVLLARVLYRKDTGDKKFVVVDAAMNDLLRPSLYDAYHEIRPVDETRRRGPVETVDVVGPVCESGDFLAKDRELGAAAEGDLLAVMSAGAYGFVMSSNYNSRPRAVEVLVDGDRYTIVRRRETYEDLVAGETTL